MAVQYVMRKSTGKSPVDCKYSFTPFYKAWYP